jgi:hypothetical protein
MNRTFIIQGSDLEQEKQNELIGSIVNTLQELLHDELLEKFSIPNGDSDYDIDEDLAMEYLYNKAQDMLSQSSTILEVDIS